MPYVVEFGHEHHESTRERDLLGQSGALVGDRVLGHLAHDELLGLEHVLDARRGTFGLDVVRVVLDVALVQHRVLGGADVDERRFHAGQHVLDPTHIDVPVDLEDVVGRSGHVVLDQRSTFEDRDVRGVRGRRGRSSGSDRSPDPCGTGPRRLVMVDSSSSTGSSSPNVASTGRGLPAPALVALATVAALSALSRPLSTLSGPLSALTAALGRSSLSGLAVLAAATATAATPLTTTTVPSAASVRIRPSRPRAPRAPRALPPLPVEPDGCHRSSVSGASGAGAPEASPAGRRGAPIGRGCRSDRWSVATCRIGVRHGTFPS